jgi:aldehyde:ferredoxin oxidoreductase
VRRAPCTAHRIDIEGDHTMGDMTFKEIKTLNYKKPVIEKGYTNQSLYVNLSKPEISIKPVTERMKEVFIGGRGFDLWLMWNAVKGTTKWNDPENEVCIACGPLAGTPIYPGAGKSIVTAISPTTGSVMDSNVGGYFGPYLKFAGFDALEVQGKASGEAVLLIDGIEGKIELLEVSGLPDSSYDLSMSLTEYFGRGKPHNVSIVSTGPGAKHTLLGCLNFTWYDLKRGRARYKQAGRGGIGTVFADKGIKALVARYNTVGVASNHPADEAELKEVG